MLHPFYSVAIRRAIHEAIATSHNEYYGWCASQSGRHSVYSLLHVPSVVNVQQCMYAPPVIQCYKEEEHRIQSQWVVGMSCMCPQKSITES